MRLFVKNMVCNRCVMVVRQILDTMGIQPVSVSLGEIALKEALPKERYHMLREELTAVGFELLDDKRQKLVEKVKTLLIERIHNVDEINMKVNFSVFLQQQLTIDYNYLSTLFSQTEGLTIEQFIILQRIERAKELLVYNELTLSEIAYKLGYSSVQHLSTQFKKITGLTPSHFKQIKDRKRKPLDQV
ncbi:MAG: AraC family transcriptional regulator [Pseudosphingobacterium sp.]|nr:MULTISPECIES: AraC family transcriptional regulator [Olivibacter]MCL4637531.1 AraC family transcriptional regulator [Olivibacter sp. UJ_SKK_5.1]MDM8175174.1 AraC family transcriptional regulator [Olivibacter sp. 47]MDX3913149.1 AraC family transcriptional regulator [Pseudosphingobacterium sp.]QEL04372.1 AraC family transcriptional regulator [Olivibacter sp. LS-1]